jgi:integrase
VDPKVVQQRLGHSRPDIVMRHYAHVLHERADEAADMISGQLGYVIPAEFSVNPVEV